MRTRTFVVVGTLAALLLAGFASYYASSHPDGLEYVARQAGFADSAQDSQVEGSPLSDYRVKGVENEAVSGGLAGLLGALVVAGLVGGLAYAMRRRRPAGEDLDRLDRREPADRRGDLDRLDRQPGDG